ncbi:hypothetical protein JHK86_000797 [Glycine max]|nr:hypothetical protein JHK86_000797 [Glycine max]
MSMKSAFQRETHTRYLRMMCLVVKSNDNVFYDVGGMDRKGRVFGLGSEIGKYKPSSSILFDGFSSHEYEKMKSQLSNLTKENKNMKEVFLASQEESCLFREQMTRFMESFSLGQTFQPVQCDPQPPIGDRQDDE